MSNQSQDIEESNIRLYWKAIYEFTNGLQIIIFRIDHNLVYKIDTTYRTISILANQGEIIPVLAKPITREEYERYLLLYLV